MALNTLDRLSKLIAQADGASTPAEAAAFMERAEKLSAMLNVELAVARAHAVDKTKIEEPVESFRVNVNSYSAKPIHRQAMMDLWLAIADAHEIRCTVGGDNFLSFAYGFPSDIDLAVKLFGTLSLQMVRDADAAIKRGDQKYEIDMQKRKIGLDARIYRRNFYEGFAKAVAGRLWTARQEAIRRSDSEAGGSSALVLRNKAEEVDAFYTEKTKHLSLRGSYKSLDNSDSFASGAQRHGNAAGRSANLGTSDKDVSGADRRAISG